MDARTFAIIIAILIVLFIIELIRRQKMTFKYSVFWLSASAATLLIAFNTSLLNEFAQLAGFKLTSNFLFFLYLAFISLLCLFQTVYINEQNSRTESLAQSIAALNYKIDQLTAETRKPDDSPKS